MGKQKRNKGKGLLSSKIKLKEFHANLVQGKLFSPSNIHKRDKIGNNIQFLKNQFMALEDELSDEETDFSGVFWTLEGHNISPNLLGQTLV